MISVILNWLKSMEFVHTSEQSKSPYELLGIFAEGIF